MACPNSESSSIVVKDEISDAVADGKSTIKKPKKTSWLKGKGKEASLVITAMRPYNLHFHSATVASDRGKPFRVLIRSENEMTLHRPCRRL
jgi:hypothetical protein